MGGELKSETSVIKGGKDGKEGEFQVHLEQIV